MFRNTLILILFMLILSACTAQSNETPTAIAISKVIATLEISPTPNTEQLAATRTSSSPTPIPPTATVIPTETPYVGIFVGEAQVAESMQNFTEPIFGPRIVSNVPTANPQRCVTVPIDAPYLTAWTTNTSVSQRMGCPIQAGFGFFGQVQIFENGLMYSYPDLNAVWAIRPLQGDELSGTYDYLENPAESSTIGIQPPTGLIVPGDIFGDMWISVEGLRGEMGFARTEPQEIGIGIQRFQNGTFLLDSPSGQVYALITDGTVLGPFLTSETEPATIGGTVPEVTEEAETPQG